MRRHTAQVESIAMVARQLAKLRAKMVTQADYGNGWSRAILTHQIESLLYH